MSRSTPHLICWKIYQSDQIEEVGVYWRRDSENALTRREGEVVFGRFSKIEGLIGFLIGQRAKRFGFAFAIDLRIPESGRFWIGRWHELCFNST